MNAHPNDQRVADQYANAAILAVGVADEDPLAVGRVLATCDDRDALLVALASLVDVDHATTDRKGPRPAAPCEDPATRKRIVAATGLVDPWFPDGADAGSPALAKVVCLGCPKKTECLLDAVTTSPHNDHGTRGGTTPAQRREMRKEMNA